MRYVAPPHLRHHIWPLYSNHIMVERRNDQYVVLVVGADVAKLTWPGEELTATDLAELRNEGFTIIEVVNK